MATKPGNSKGKGSSNMDWSSPVRSGVDVGSSNSNKNESDVSVVIVICLAIMALTFVLAIPLLGIAYMDMNNMINMAGEQYKIMKEETRKRFKAKYGKLAEQKMKETVAKLRNEGLWDASGSSGFTGATPNAGNASDDGTRPDVNAEFEKMAIMKPKRKLNNKNNPEINQKGNENV